jgi:argininosuccinate lyase
MGRLWDRGDSLDQLVLGFTAGEDHRLDDRLVAYDVKGSAAHARMLGANGYLAAEDLRAIERALAEIGEAHARGTWRVSLEEEDCHTAIENRLVKALGEAGKRIHLGRSRNDQVLVALRLWLKDALEETAA